MVTHKSEGSPLLCCLLSEQSFTLLREQAVAARNGVGGWGEGELSNPLPFLPAERSFGRDQGLFPEIGSERSNVLRPDFAAWTVGVRPHPSGELS